MNKKIDFYIIGAQKSATTSIYEYLNSIEDVLMPLVKEMQVFTNDKLYHSFPKNMESFYKNELNIKLRGMADVEILYAYNTTAQRIYNYNPNAKIIIMLRNPIDRAYSSYHFSRKNQRETIETFEEAISLEKSRKSTLSQNDRLALTYLDVSMYYQQVRTFINIFGKSNVLILTMEEFIENKEKEFYKVLDFLNLKEEVFDKELLKKRFNEGGDVKSKSLQSILNNENILRHLYNNFIPLRIRMKIRSNLINPLLAKNSKSFKYDKLSEDTYQKLMKYFRHDVEKLSKYTNKDFLQLWYNASPKYLDNNFSHDLSDLI